MKGSEDDQKTVVANLFSAIQQRPYFLSENVSITMLITNSLSFAVVKQCNNRHYNSTSVADTGYTYSIKLHHGIICQASLFSARLTVITGDDVKNREVAKILHGPSVKRTTYPPITPERCGLYFNIVYHKSSLFCTRTMSERIEACISACSLFKATCSTHAILLNERVALAHRSSLMPLAFSWTMFECARLHSDTVLLQIWLSHPYKKSKYGWAVFRPRLYP